MSLLKDEKKKESVIICGRAMTLCGCTYVKIYGIIKLCEGLPKFLRGKLEGLLIFNIEFMRVIREGLV